MPKTFNWKLTLKKNSGKILIIFILGFLSRYLFNEYFNLTCFSLYITIFSVLSINIPNILYMFNFVKYISLSELFKEKYEYIQLISSEIFEKTFDDISTDSLTMYKKDYKGKGKAIISSGSSSNSNRYIDQATSTTDLTSFTNKPKNLDIIHEADSKSIHELDNSYISNSFKNNSNLYELDGKPIYNSYPNKFNSIEQPPMVNYESKPKNFSPWGDISENSTSSNSTTGAVVNYPQTNFNYNNTNPLNHNEIKIKEPSRPDMTFSDITFSSEEFNLHKSGIKGKIKLGFKYAISKFTEEKDVETIYLKYKDISKRKFYWHIWEKNRDNFNSYPDFKAAWDKNTPVFKQITKEIKTDISNEIKDLIKTKNPWQQPGLDSNNRPRVYDSREIRRQRYRNQDRLNELNENKNNS
uniref:hypothetical protein n=1 Tax=Pleurocordyceps sinensis TaxID=99896 RepID=UPI00220E5C94|nr:hypothetical protein OOD12_mgp20 [Pleurocordyceps sinensis]UXR11747.1 hypothetical protein [Pleurocordyceps sinensis]